jgi:hypothetical protein
MRAKKIIYGRKGRRLEASSSAGLISVLPPLAGYSMQRGNQSWRLEARGAVIGGR